MHYEGWKKGDAILYKKEKAEAFTYVSPKGKAHEVLVPDTIDLAEMARLSINAMTEVTDPDADYEIYFWMLIDGKTPYMRHDNADMCIMKFQESLPLMRIMSGSTQNEHVEKAWMENTLKSVGDDGHIYQCHVGRPWWTNDSNDFPTGADADELRKFSIDPAYSGRFLSAFVLYYLRSGEELWKEKALRLTDALIDCAIHKDGYAYFSPSPYFVAPCSGSTRDFGREEPLIGTEVRHALLGCLHVYREFNYAPALKFAGELLSYIIDVLHCIADDGEFIGHANFVKKVRCFEFMGTEAHFHAHTSVLHYMLEYALLTGDRRYLYLVVKGYDYAKVHSQALLGFMGEYVKSAEYEQHETCEIADMIAVAIKLSQAGIRDCYNDADLWLRNMGSEGQLTPEKAVALKNYARTEWYDSPQSDNYGYENAVDRNIGGFAGWMTANNFFDPAYEKHVMMHCCTGNMTRALYYAWKAAITFENGVVSANLLMNMENQYAEMVSYIPYSGRTEIALKTDCELRLRLPDWADASHASLIRNGTALPVKLEGHYLIIADCKAGDKIVLSVPMTETNKIIWVEKQRYFISMRGNEVIDIQPKGTSCPSFNRGYYNEGNIRYKKVTRFLSDEDIVW